jgi:hypothetical protein
VKIRTAVLAGALAVAVVPAVALDAKPATHPTHSTTPSSTNAAKPTVMFVFHGKLTGYTAANGTTNGSVWLTVSRSNHLAKSLKNQTLTFAIGSAAKVQLHNGDPIAVGDRASSRCARRRPLGQPAVGELDLPARRPGQARLGRNVLPRRGMKPVPQRLPTAL